MDADIYVDNNNPPPVAAAKKKWGSSGILASLEEDEGEDVMPSGVPEVVQSRGRRTSWHPGKMTTTERKRRKSLVPPGPQRAKRHSWWQIFVPDQLHSR